MGWAVSIPPTPAVYPGAADPGDLDPTPGVDDADADADDNPDGWRSDSACFNLEVMANESLCRSLTPRCAWQEMFDGEGGTGGGDAGFCTEGGCGLMRSQSNCTGYAGGGQCQWSRSDSVCTDRDFGGDDSADAQETPCYLLDDGVECNASKPACVWWDNSGVSGDGPGGGSCLATEDCLELPEALCHDHGNETDDHCSWQDTGGDGLCGNTSDPDMADLQAEVRQLSTLFLDHFPRSSKLCITPHAPRAML